MVRIGHHAEREVTTAAGAVPVRAPLVNDKRIDEPRQHDQPSTIPGEAQPADEDGDEELRVVVFAVRRGSTVLRTTGGPADAETGLACTAETRFAVASVSKQFTAAAVLLLVERGDVALDDPLSRWFGQGPRWWREVTVEQLLTHTSGLGHWNDVGGIEQF